MNEATRVVEAKKDKNGQLYWESMASPSYYKIRAEVRVPPELPGIVIFVHGVNSEGEWYKNAEAALIEGLNQRLGRNDLRPNKYLVNDPHYPTEEGNSPVIHFYWGYRAPEGKERDYLVPLRDRSKQSVWIKKHADKWKCPQFWGGGPFQNGTNNLPQLWHAYGFKRRAWAAFVPIDIQAMNSEWDRQLQDAPSREYYAHAVGRLARLIDKIRSRYPGDTISLMSHSQGTMIAMAASLLCKGRGPDALFLMNSPYALDDKVTDTMTSGDARPTSQARITTLENLIRRIERDKRPLTEEDLEDLRVGVTPEKKRWRPDGVITTEHGTVPERDNHGRLYVYFTPHDRVMGSAALQSIGWQGVPTTLAQKHAAVLKQRMLARSMACGDMPGMKPFGTLPDMQPDPVTGKKKPFWDGNRKVMGIKELWVTPDPHHQVMVNAEAVPNPLKGDELIHFDEPRSATKEVAERDGKLFRQDIDFPFFHAIYQAEQWTEEQDPYSESGKKRRVETAEELMERISSYIPEPTDHSSLPQHTAFMARVAAYDLPIGFCDSYEDKPFWKELKQEADWVLGKDPYYLTGALDVPGMPSDVISETVADELSRRGKDGG